MRGRQSKDRVRERKDCECVCENERGQAEVLTLSSSQIATPVTVIAQSAAASEVAAISMFLY